MTMYSSLTIRFMLVDMVFALVRFLKVNRVVRLVSETRLVKWCFFSNCSIWLLLVIFNRVCCRGVFAVVGCCCELISVMVFGGMLLLLLIMCLLMCLMSVLWIRELGVLICNL